MFVIDKVNNVRGKLVSVFKNSNVATLGLEKSKKKDLDFFLWKVQNDFKSVPD